MNEKKTQHLDTELSGNTKASSSKKYRNWCLTIFHPDEAETLKKMEYKYILMGKEICPNSGRLHYQSFISLKNATTFNAIKKKLPTTNFRHCNGSALQNFVYCSKDKNIFFEDGKRPYARIGVKELKEMSYEDIIDFDARCHKAYIHAKNLLENDIDIDELHKDIKVFFIQGPSGIGKTERAKQLVRNLKDKYGSKVNMVKYENGFYIGIGSAKIAIYDDFRDSHMKASEFINFIDYNIHHLNIKGGEKQNKYELIIITSIQKLDSIYRNMNGEPRKQWERRIELINMYEDVEEDDLDIEI